MCLLLILVHIITILSLIRNEEKVFPTIHKHTHTYTHTLVLYFLLRADFVRIYVTDEFLIRPETL